jgi:hypothetical protein
MDMNQVMSDGKTVIYAFQCSGNSGVGVLDDLGQ